MEGDRWCVACRIYACALAAPHALFRFLLNRRREHNKKNQTKNAPRAAQACARPNIAAQGVNADTDIQAGVLFRGFIVNFLCRLMLARYPQPENRE
jgi:hypothetical protein